ncbi:MAG TPA: YetF domain-containing protein [Opitutales bacterium]|nr:YetF domain-containing protein [Opitutales bacterium]
MWEAVYDFIAPWGEAFELDVAQVAVRTVIVYAVAIFLVRIGNKRFMGHNSAFDLLLGILLGSIFSRAITGQAPFIPSLASGAILVGLHWIAAAAAIRFERFAPWIKGRSRTLVRNGKVDEKAMRKSHIGAEDLNEALRAGGQITDLEDVELASLERNGTISVVARRRAPRLLEVQVEPGVQTIRIEVSS